MCHCYRTSNTNHALTGNPGCGKTHLYKAKIWFLFRKGLIDLVIASACTAKAAANMSTPVLDGYTCNYTYGIDWRGKGLCKTRNNQSLVRRCIIMFWDEMAMKSQRFLELEDAAVRADVGGSHDFLFASKHGDAS